MTREERDTLHAADEVASICGTTVEALAAEIGMPAAATFGESILKAQVQIARAMKNPDQYRKRAMYRAIAQVTAANMEGN